MQVFSIEGVSLIKVFLTRSCFFINYIIFSSVVSSPNSEKFFDDEIYGELPPNSAHAHAITIDDSPVYHSQVTAHNYNYYNISCYDDVV